MTEKKKPIGILNYETSKEKFNLSLELPSPDLRGFIEHYWFVEWDLRGQEAHTQENLTHPTVHLVIEQDHSRLVGVVSGKFRIRLEDAGYVFGVKFLPGAFYPFMQSPVSSFTDKEISIDRVFDVDVPVVEKTILSQADRAIQIALMEDFLRERLPEVDENISLIQQIADAIVTDRRITKVDDLAKRFHMSKRSLQRLFHDYVGISPKWMIQRYRLHRALEQLAHHEIMDWRKFALELGYFDQSHFIHDFKKLVGKTPADYAQQFDK